jgi:hypothetical protein
MADATKVKPSEFDEDTRERLAGEVEQALVFLGTELSREEIVRRVGAVLANPNVDEILPAVVKTPTGKPWLLPIVGDVLERVMAVPPTEETEEPAAPAELSQEDSPQVPQRPVFIPPRDEWWLGHQH